MGIDVRRLALAAAFTVASSSVWATAVWATPVTLNAVAEPGGAVLNEPVQWQVRRLDKKGIPVPTPVAVGDKAVLKTDLPAGHYMLSAQRGTTAIEQGLIVGSTAEVRNIVVGATNAAMLGKSGTGKAAATTAVATGAPATGAAAPAAATTPAKTAATTPVKSATTQPAALPVAVANSKLVIGMIPSSGRSAITDPIKWQVFTYSKGATENGHLVAEKTVPSASFALPAGSYVIRAAYKGTQADLVIPLAPNQSYTYTINLYAGQAKLTAVKPTGPAREPVAWQVVREKPGPDGKYQLVATSNDASPQLLLREGKYLVVGRLGDLWGVEPISVVAGRTSAARVKLKRGEGAPIVVASAN